MNLLELYTEKPSNYFICAERERSRFAGGIGKTSQMQYLANKICGKKVHGRVVIPIYIKMNEWNIKRVESDVLYQDILAHFQNYVTKKAVLEMLQKSTNHQFLFLLDGINELNNYLLESGQTVYDCVINNIKELIGYESVHFIITSRMEHEIVEEEGLRELFDRRYLCALERCQYRAYLQMVLEEALPESLPIICENPMLLRLFKEVYKVNKEAALSINSIYGLIKEYFRLDTEFKKLPGWKDYLSQVSNCLIRTLFPYVEYRRMSTKLQGKREEDMVVLLKEALSVCEVPKHINFPLVEKVMKMMGTFQHDLFRAFFAVQGFEQRWEYANARSETRTYMEALHENMQYDSSKGMDYSRRTQYMDFCEFLYAERNDKLESLLKKCNMKEEALESSFLFYYDLAGLYKDLIQPKLAEELSDIAIPLLEKLEEKEMYTDFQLADCYNYLGYCIATRDDSIQYLERAKTILEQNDDLSKKEKRLLGRILSNMGAFYYARRDYESALVWHKKAMDYRVEKELWEDVVHSCRTIMSDYYMLKQYDKAYEFYLKGVEFLGEGVVDIELEERAMGTEIALLGNPGLTEERQVELLQRLFQQTKAVFEGATSSHRKNLNLLESLYKKLCQLESCLIQSTDSDVKHIVLEYIEKCEGILKG